MLSREQVFDSLLASLGTTDPLGSVITRSARLCGGSGLVVNELGEVSRSVGAAPTHLIAEWVREQAFLERPYSTASKVTPAETEISEGQIGRWLVRARSVRIRQREHALVVAVSRDSDTAGAGSGHSETAGRVAEDETAVLILDTAAKILQAFEGFESFSMSTRREESSRLIRNLVAGINPGREPAAWNLLENFGFEPYAGVRILRARWTDDVSETSPTSARRSVIPRELKGIVLSASDMDSAVPEMTALVALDYPIGNFIADTGLAVGVSEPFSALSQALEMVRTADVALSTADAGTCVYVEQMRPVEWAAARLSSRFDRTIARRFLESIANSHDAWTTLTTYIDCGAHVAETARRLNVHENTVRYRLGQIENVIGARLADPRVSADIVVALECRSQAERR